MDIISYKMGQNSIEPDKPDQTKTATPTTQTQVITPDAGYELASVTVNPVTSSIDSNIQAENIKKDVTILGVTGTVEASSGDEGKYDITTALDPSNPRFSNNRFPKLCAFIKTIPLINTSDIINGTGLFFGFSNLETIPLIDTSYMTNMEECFYGCTNLTTIPLIDTSACTTTSSMFYNCSNLVSVPLLNTSSNINFSSMFYGCSSLTEVPAFNTVSSANFGNMFYGCTNLTTVPVFNTSNSSLRSDGLKNMFKNCPNLSTQSLNNILQMCVNATNYTGTKTLATLGLTSTDYPVSTIQALSNYQTFISAGWTIGY